VDGAPARVGVSTAATLAGRIGRHALLYAVGTALLVAASVATLAVFTRLMPPAEFGKLVVLLVLTAGLSTLFSLATRQGTIGLVFGATEDDGASLEEEEVSEAPEAVGEKRDMLGTGLLLVAMVALAGTAGAWASATELSRLLFGTPADAEAVRLAAATGGLGACWEILLMVPRFERRPRIVVLFEVARPIVALGVAIPFVSGGAGAEGALTGLLIATAGLTLIVLIYLRRTYRVRFHPRFVPSIIRLGSVFVPLVCMLYVINKGGVLLLPGSVPRSEIGLYGVAVVFGFGIARLAGVFFMAWIPMKRTSLFVAVYKERGHGWMFSTLTTYFVAAIGLVFVELTAASGALVAIASPAYSEAEVLIPAVGAAAVAQAGFQLAWRITAFPGKRVALSILTTLAAVLFVGAALVLVPWLGVYGVPVAASAALLMPTVSLLIMNQRGTRAIPFDYRRLAVIAVGAGACVGAHSALIESAGSARLLLDIGTAVAYPALLVVSRTVRVSEVATLLRVARDGMAERRRVRGETATSLAGASAEQVQTLRAVARHVGRDGSGSPEPGSVVAALRRIAAAGPPTKRDDAIGRYLLSDLSRAERDALARGLWRRGVSPAELDRLEQTLSELASLPLHDWPTAA